MSWSRLSPSGYLVCSGWGRRVFFRGGLCSDTPYKGRVIVSCPLPSPCWPSPVPEEVAAGLDRVVSELWKSPQAVLLPPPEIPPRSWGATLCPAWAEGQALGSPWRRWRRRSLVCPGPLPQAVSPPPVLTRGRQAQVKAAVPGGGAVSGPALTTWDGDRACRFQPGRPLSWVCSRGPLPVQAVSTSPSLAWLGTWAREP